MRKAFVVLVLFISGWCTAQTATDFYKRAVLKYKDKDYGGAITEYTRAIDLNNSSAVLYNNRGVCKYKMQRYSEAIEDYTKAIDADPNYVHAYFNKGNSHMGIGEYDQALIAYDKTLEIDPNYKKAYVNRSKVMYQQGNYDGSIADLNKGLELGARNKEKLHLELGNAYLQLNKLDEALSNYNDALKINGNYYKAIVNRGQVYIKQGEWDLAIADFNMALRLDPTNGEGYFYRGLCRIYQIDGVKAKKKSKKTVQQIRDNKKMQELACLDFKKAKEFNYSRALEALELYCKDVK